MNMHVNVQEFGRPAAPTKAGLLKRMMAFLGRMLSGSKGDQGGWEAGARGM